MGDVRYVVLYARANTRKHKKWEGDGYLTIHTNGEMELNEENGRELSRSSITSKKLAELGEGYIMMVGGYEIEIQEETTVETEKLPSLPSPTVSRHPVNPLRTQSSLILNGPKILPTVPSFIGQKRPGDGENVQPIKKAAMNVDSFSSSITTCVSSVSITNTDVRKPFCSPLVTSREALQPSFVVNHEEVDAGISSPVTLDGIISRHLRDHQKEGVSFLYSRLKNRGGGAILADDMGLGKTIQTIATCWTLLKRKVSRTEEQVQKCLLVVPSSLLNNWRSEFTKWFRCTRMPALIVKKSSDIRCYSSAFKITPFMVISYDMALRYSSLLASLQFDLIVCDEGHRLKNSQGKLRQRLLSCSIPRRLLLTGTPVQNDLDELHSLLDFVCPSKFGTSAEFRALCRRNDEGKGDGEGQDGEDGMERVQRAIGEILLRRTSDVNTVHLPDKHEYIFFCAPSRLQKRVFQAISDHVTGDPFVLIDQMRKASNHPAILYKHLQKGIDDQQKSRVSYASFLSVFPQDYGNRPAGLADSGKLLVLAEMLNSFRSHGECTVVVSQYTKTLDMIGGLCTSLSFRIFRLDGNTAVQNRQSLVDAFNTEMNADNIFLLSSKAGGVGLNLIGASRLVLFDLDWNPASDLQAMARIWRDGQPRVCHIYRLLTAGTIDEKILQRQIKKTGLAAVIDIDSINQSSEKLSFRDEDLADIFSLKETGSDTHDLLECTCGGRGLLPLEREEEEEDERREGEELEDDEMVDSIACVDETADMKRNEDEGIEDEEEEEMGELPSEPASMAELFRWRHYSPEDETAWNHLKAQAGIASLPLVDLTFAFHYSAAF